MIVHDYTRKGKVVTRCLRFLGGAAGDALRSSNGQKFSAKDHDYDTNAGNCAEK